MSIKKPSRKNSKVKKKSKAFDFVNIFNEGVKHYDMIIISDSKGKVELYNNFLSQLCNSANKDEILLQDVTLDQLFKSEKESFPDIFKTLQDKGVYNGRLNFILSFNQLIPFEVKAIKINDKIIEKFKYAFFFKLIEIEEIERDPLEQKKFVKQNQPGQSKSENFDLITSLEELERLKEDFLSSVSHELRTPLASIIGFAETLKNDPNLPKEIFNEFIDIILNEGKRLAATINDLLDVSQLYKNSSSLQMRNIILQDLLNKAYEQFKPLTSNIEFAILLPEKPIVVAADESKLQQAINNLVSNAIKFTLDKGKVLISLYETDNNHVIEIKDTGIGIPEKDRDKIFDRFYRVYRPGLEIRGVGLGLSITKKIVDLHGFKLEYESKENQGSTFKILIPR